MFYVVLTLAMFLGNAQPGRIVVTEMDMSAGPSSLPTLNQADAPVGTRQAYKTRAQVEQALILFHCGAPTSTAPNGATTYECLGM